MPKRIVRILHVYWDRQVARNLRYDFPSSIVVFLVALPLCLGIAMASEAPMFSGVITGIVAGVLVSFGFGSRAFACVEPHPIGLLVGHSLTRWF